MIHIPVLKKEVLEFLKPEPNENFIDCTIGAGGHTAIILEAIKPNGKVLGIDQDQEMIQNTRLRLKDKRLILVCDNFVNLKKIVEEQRFGPVSGILLDLGMSSWHLEESKKGFSFQENESLDMRYGNTELKAETIVNQYSEKEIEQILKEYGEERLAKRISKAIIEQRKKNPIKTTFELVEIIKESVPYWYQRKRIHFATRTFQALRIAVNDELNNLRTVLPQIIEVLNSGGRIVVISFHSLEDRIVKHFLREQSRETLKINTKKPIRPSQEEVRINPRSRSAKLRAGIKLK